MTNDDAAVIGGYLRRWAGPAWLASESFGDYEWRCRQAFRIPQTAFSALESYRWAVRSVLRLQGYRYVKQLQVPLASPTLQLHGALDPAVLPRTAQGSGRYVMADYEWRLLDGLGHFPHREASELVSGEILRWAKAAF
jgi:pimeloyl-ACP methyl ester carboxylesterase